MFKPKEIPMCMCYIIKHRVNGNIVFTYKTHQGNEKKAFFNSHQHALNALRKYIPNNEEYYISTIM